MGLKKIYAISIVSGLTFGITIKLTGEPSIGLGSIILNFLIQSVDSRTRFYVMIISVIISIISIYGLAVFMRQVYEQRLAGIITAVLGFSGSILILSVTQDNIHFVFLGVGMWVLGMVLATRRKMKNHG